VNTLDDILLRSQLSIHRRGDHPPTQLFRVKPVLACRLQFVDVRPSPVFFRDPVDANPASLLHPVECWIEGTFIGASTSPDQSLIVDIMAYPWRPGLRERIFNTSRSREPWSESDFGILRCLSINTLTAGKVTNLSDADYAERVCEGFHDESLRSYG
jgi:hypothetical protein